MSFLSFEFLILAVAAAVGLALLGGPLRSWTFLGLSSAFAASFLDARGCVSTAVFLLAGYGAAKLAARDRRWVAPCVVALVAAFVYMRSYEFLDLFLPARWLTDALATAGLSFLLFKILHVVVDAGGRRLGALSLLGYLNYSLNFTTFLLGPIQRIQDFNEQWDGRREALAPGFEAHLDALNRVLRGLVKKFVLAEYLRQYTLAAAVDVAGLGWGELGARTYAYYFFLYCDFSGYCDVVIGTGSLIGIRPPENFRLPFLAPNVAEFWMRVHRSLTTWLTDYVFNPLFAGCLRSRTLRTHPQASMRLALLGTMLVSGLWHGTTWSFLLFGLVHGFYLVVFRWYEQVATRRLGRERMQAWRATWTSKLIGTLLTFNVTAAAYLFFVVDTQTLLALFERLTGIAWTAGGAP